MAPFIKFNWHGVKIASVVEGASRRSVKNGAEAILAEAQKRVPLDVGTLMGTGRVDVDGTEAAVSYNTVYAAKLHQHPEYSFQNGREGRWLQNAVEAHEGTLDAMAKPFRDSLGRFARRPG